MKNLCIAVVACFALAPILACHGSDSDPPEISVKEDAEAGTTTDPAVRVLARHVYRPEIPDREQIVQLDLFIDAGMTVDRTTLFVCDPSNDLIAEANLKASREKNEFHYTISLKKPLLKMSTVHVRFKDGQTKRLLLGTTQLPKSGEQGGADQPATAQESKPEGNEKPLPESKVAPR